MEIPPEVRYVVREGKSIAYQRLGSGDRRLVVIPTGFGSLDLLWADAAISGVFVRGSERCECAMDDPLGWGLSDPVDHVPTIEERAADLGAVMDAAGFARATASTGYDATLGALVFAAQHPERVEALVLMAPFAQGWLSAPVEELVGWEDAEQVASHERAWQLCPRTNVNSSAAVVSGAANGEPRRRPRGSAPAPLRDSAGATRPFLQARDAARSADRAAGARADRGISSFIAARYRGLGSCAVVEKLVVEFGVGPTAMSRVEA